MSRSRRSVDLSDELRDTVDAAAVEEPSSGGASKRKWKKGPKFGSILCKRK